MKIQVCTGKRCSEKFSEYIIKRLQNDKIFYDISDIDIQQVSCMGSCESAANIKIDGTLHHYMNPLKASDLIFQKK